MNRSSDSEQLHRQRVSQLQMTSGRHDSAMSASGIRSYIENHSLLYRLASRWFDMRKGEWGIGWDHLAETANQFLIITVIQRHLEVSEESRKTIRTDTGCLNHPSDLAIFGGRDLLRFLKQFFVQFFSSAQSDKGNVDVPIGDQP